MSASPGPAARRFFQTFRRWAILSDLEASVQRSPRCACRRAHSTAPVASGSQDGSRARVASREAFWTMVKHQRLNDTSVGSKKDDDQSTSASRVTKPHHFRLNGPADLTTSIVSEIWGSDPRNIGLSEHEKQSLGMVDDATFELACTEEDAQSFHQMLLRQLESICERRAILQSEEKLAWSMDVAPDDSARPAENTSFVSETTSETAALHLIEGVKQACRYLTHPVVLVTARKPVADPDVPDQPWKSHHGVTVSSFTSVSLDPDPIVSFNLRLPSASWSAITASSTFRVHVLSASETGAAIADTFAKPNSELPMERLHRSGVQLDFPSKEPALITHPQGVLGHLTAEMIPDKCIRCGDHVIVVAKVIDCSTFATAAAPSQKDVAALAYRNRQYQSADAPIRSYSLPTSQSPGEVASKPSAKITFKGYAGSLGSFGALRADAQNSSTATGSRHFSTSTTSRSAFALDHRSLADFVDPAALRKTVADFLAVPDDNKPPTVRYPRMRAIIKANEHVRQARRILTAQVEGSDPITEEETAKLERFIATNEGRIRKKLAYIAMLDLRLMLDKGRVDFERIGWLEQTIESGSAAYADDLKKIGQMFESRKLDHTQYQALRNKLLEENDILKTEVNRLKDFVVDDDNDA